MYEFEINLDLLLMKVFPDTFTNTVHRFMNIVTMQTWNCHLHSKDPRTTNSEIISTAIACVLRNVRLESHNVNTGPMSFQHIVGFVIFSRIFV